MKKEHSQLERNILAIISSNPELIDVADLEADDFANGYCKEIFSTLLEMRRDNKEIAIPTLYVEMERKEMKITGLFNNIDWADISPAYITEFSTRLKELAIRRKISELSDDSDVNVTRVLEEISKLQNKLSVRSVKQFSEVYTDYLSDYKERSKHEGFSGITTGFKLIDEQAPFEPSTLAILAARSSVGKSALALNIARNAAEYGHRVIFVSAEMSIPRLLDRLFSIITEYPAENFRKCKADSHLAGLEETAKRLNDNLGFIYMPYASSEDVCALIRKHHIKKKVDLVVVDYLQYLSDKKSKNDNEATRVANMTRNFKNLAGGCENVVLAMSQVSRQAAMEEGGRPKLHHLRDSGAVEQDADIVLILNREERSDAVATLDLAKNRNGEADVSVNLTYCNKTTKFTDAT